jgi:formylglycine-generating enzyme required for sulfatase activity
MKNRVLLFGIIAFSATILSTLGIRASDALRGIDHEASVGGSGVCQDGTVLVHMGGTALCADVYEVSIGGECPHDSPKNVYETEKNIEHSECYGASQMNADPWTYVTLTQAQKICAVRGARLPTSDEWYALSLGTPPEQCVLEGSRSTKTGSSGCVSSSGVEDAVGNVWEWVNETVTGQEYRGRALPESGYVTSVDSTGVPITSDSERADVLYGSDYVWTKSDGVFGMIRGGFYGSGEDGGVYTVNASVPTNFATEGLGFRCVEDV